jgi:O-antigen/teichoic acid export membrane protein
VSEVTDAEEESAPGSGASKDTDPDAGSGKPPRFPRMHAFLARHEFLTSVMKVMSGTGLAQLVAALGTLYVTHNIDPTDWGLYGAVISAAQFVIPVAALRYDMAIVLPREDGEAKRIFRLATMINAIMSILSMLVMIPLGGVLSNALDHPEARWWMLGVGPIIFTYGEVYVVNYWANRRKQFGVIGTNAVWNQSVTVAGRIASCLVGFGALGQLIATFLGEVAALNNFRTRLGPDLRGIEEDRIPFRLLMRKYRKMPLLTAPNAIVDAVRQQGVNMMILFKFSPALYGKFNIAWVLMQIPSTVINQALSQVFFQKLSVTDAGHMFKAVRQSVIRSFLIGIVPFALLYFLIPPVLPWLLGDKFAQSAPIAVALVPWLFVNFITSPVSNMFIVTRNNGIALAFAIVYAVVPLGYLSVVNASIETTIYGMSLVMALLLAMYIGLALITARRFDNKYRDKSADVIAAEEAGITATQDED